jgi:hypothetical protein
MYLNTTPAEPERKPCIRDLAELLATHLLPQLVMLAPLAELARRCHEIAAQHPRFREETPLVLAGEHRRRQRLAGALHVAGRGPQDGATAQPAYAHG